MSFRIQEGDKQKNAAEETVERRLSQGLKFDCRRYQKDKRGQLNCPRKYAPVCGTDGLTYGNECMLCSKIMCGSAVDLTHEGRCDECSEFLEPEKGHPPVCTADHGPVCGSDNVTYPNKCDFCAAKKKSGGTLEIQKEGECPKEPYVCSDHSETEKCTNEDNPVCSTTAVTYANKCLFCVAWRASEGHLTIIHDGECELKDKCSVFPEPEKDEPFMCTLIYNPVCGSDDVTYTNLCYFCNAKRGREGNLTVVHEGECKPKSECSAFPEPEKDEPIICTMEFRPLCGSDGETYDNLCLFCAAKWKRGGNLTIIHEGECEPKET
ncbi:ovomucoid-like [Rhineura floridana]|uniref:ovomucoid-like n=1 Tax=Rhineura floridana TaxID=261503 RepID=UPI002AC8076A|nr:ovomucoid-like [Rhineura floridana]